MKPRSPQAKGRVEHTHAVYQDRFVKELRVRGIQLIVEANEVLEGAFIDALNEKFMKPPACEEDAHSPWLEGQSMDEIFC